MITWLLIAGGAGALGYFAIFFDTSAAVDGSMRVNNLGLMNTRTNGIIVSAVALIVGVLLALFGNRKNLLNHVPSNRGPGR